MPGRRHRAHPGRVLAGARIPLEGHRRSHARPRDAAQAGTGAAGFLGHLVQALPRRDPGAGAPPHNSRTSRTHGHRSLDRRAPQLRKGPTIRDAPRNHVSDRARPRRASPPSLQRRGDADGDPDRPGRQYCRGARRLPPGRRRGPGESDRVAALRFAGIRLQRLFQHPHDRRLRSHRREALITPMREAVAAAFGWRRHAGWRLAGRASLLLSLALVTAPARAQVSGGNLLEVQMGNYPASYAGRGPTNRVDLYDQLNLSYAFGSGLAGLRFETNRNSEEEYPYAGLSGRFVEWNDPRFRARVGNFYSMLGQGLVQRAFELSGVVLDQRFPRSR